MKEIVVAVIGNPNVGKSTLFNELTGAKQYIGNWPGVTVEKKEGEKIFGGYKIRFVDLPGTYGLSASSIDERVARDYITLEKPDVVVDIVDASNLDRNLYLALELIETGAKVVIALNMMDIAESKGISIDVDALSRELGIPIVPTVATKGMGVDELCSTIVQVAEGKIRYRPLKIKYPNTIEEAIREISSLLSRITKDINTRWLAIKLLMQDKGIVEYVEGVEGGEEIVSVTRNYVEKIRGELGEDPLFIIAEARYGMISEIMQRVVSRAYVEAVDISDLLDRVLTHRILGLPIFFVIMWSVFLFTFNVAAPIVDGIDLLFSWIGEIIESSDINPLLKSFLVNGIISGFCSILVFVPNIFFLFLAMSILEDVGYMSRAAFNLDRIMRKFGLHGKSIISMILGFGCNIPGIMSARTIESEEDRLTTILVNPLIPCSARLPVLIMIASIFFGRYAPLAVFSMYVLGIFLALFMAILIRKIILRGVVSPFVMELPPYRLPSTKTVTIQMGKPGSRFLKKARYIIFSATIIIWALAALPPGVEFGGPESYASILGRLIEPILRPLGYNWQIAVALFFGFIAKEVFIDVLGMLMGEGYEAQLGAILSPAQAYGLMVFVVVYVPCLASLATIKSETGSWKWTIFVCLYELILAFILAFAFTGLVGLII